MSFSGLYYSEYHIKNNNDMILSQESLKDLCKKNSTNHYDCNVRYENFPPLMSDGRSLLGNPIPPTVPEVHVPITKIQQPMHPIRMNWEYRRFLTKHANAIRKQAFNDCLSEAT